MVTAEQPGVPGQRTAHNFNAYRADTGEKVWSFDTQAGITGGPASYAIDGQQYVAVVATGTVGFGGSGYWAPNYARLVVFKLGGTTQLPDKVASLRRTAAQSTGEFAARPSQQKARRYTRRIAPAAMATTRQGAAR